MEVTRIVRKPVAKGNADEATRITRNPLPGAKAVRAPVRKVPTGKVAASRTPPALLPLARYALVALVFGRERAVELLEGLGEREAERAKEHLTGFAALTSAQRQARVAREFGMRSDPADELRALMSEAPEALKQEIFRRLPPYHRTFFPKRRVVPADASPTPALAALAERLIREVTR
ncbi:hypothetical protein [Hyalangium versicolor]|uniref:hypothetical protein n=1 Tax=Hyalangium versicolor TaxID=2861190 RepID=UPI001CCE391D|nr:hypothetical protein [Hyalangium versicolor]